MTMVMVKAKTHLNQTSHSAVRLWMESTRSHPRSSVNDITHASWPIQMLWSYLLGQVLPRVHTDKPIKSECQNPVC